MPKVYSDEDELYAEWLYTFLRHDEVMAEYEYFPSPPPIGLPSPCSEVATSPTPPPVPVLPPTRSPGRRDFDIAAVMFHRTADDLGYFWATLGALYIFPFVFVVVTGLYVLEWIGCALAVLLGIVVGLIITFVCALAAVFEMVALVVGRRGAPMRRGST